MDVVSVCPLRVASLRWRSRRPGDVLTVVAKATYRLLPGTCTLAEEQEDPNEHENHWDDDEKRSLHAPADLVPWKPRPEVTLVGNAFAPRGETVSRLVARMIVGAVDKTIVVHGERSFTIDGALREGARFSRMPLRWERAAGGPETRNPVGIARVMDARGSTHLPNLEPLGANVIRPDQYIEPICFAPIPIEWPSRRERVARVGGRWSPSEPMHESLDPLYFMSAPFDQHLDELRPNERIVLENLHPEHQRLVTSLPGYEPRAFVDRGARGVSELPMTADTLWIDTDRSICTLTFRAQIALDERKDGRVVIAMEMLGRPLAWSDVEPRARRSSPSVMREEGEHTMARPPLKRSNTLPFAVGPQPWPTWLPMPEGEAPREASSREAPPRSSQGDPTGTIDTPISREAIDAAIAQAAAARASQPMPGPRWMCDPSPSQPDASVPVSSPPIVAPPALVPQSPMAMSAMSVVPTPSAPPTTSVVATPAPVFSSPLHVLGQDASAARALPSLAAPLAGPVPQLATPPPASDVSSPIRPSSSDVQTPIRGLSTGASTNKASSSPPFVKPPFGKTEGGKAQPSRDAALQGVAAASNAAAASAKEAPEPAEAKGAARASAAARDPAREHVDLIWFDKDAVPRIRADRDLGEVPEKRGAAVWVKSDASAREPRDAQDVKDRRDVHGVLCRVAPLDDAGLSRVASEAYRDDGSFTPPLALIGGEIALGFDEIEALRATITVVSSFIGNDKKLRDTVDVASEALKGACPLPADVAEGLTRRVEEAFAQGPRSVAPGYLEASVEKILLSGRKYQKKTLFGEPRIRALLSMGDRAAPIPTYLPEAIASNLPLFRRFKARLIVELRPQEDQYETHADALVVLALSRVVRRAG